MMSNWDPRMINAQQTVAQTNENVAEANRNI